jgi:hypothetical protein
MGEEEDDGNFYEMKTRNDAKKQPAGGDMSKLSNSNQGGY